MSAANSGSCGNYVRWELDSKGTLTISGKGDMFNYCMPNNSPFHNLKDIKKIVIKKGVTSIGSEAFWGCSGLTSATIPESVAEIGYQAFKDCSKLSSITLPSKITSITSGMFLNCKSLKSIKIPDKVKTIAFEAFSGCSSLKSIVLPKSVKEIGYPVAENGVAFDGCSSLTDITIYNPECVINDSPASICNGFDKNGIPYFKGTIHGYTNSTAQAYAKKYDYKFKAIDQPLTAVSATNTKGDANGDNALNVRDAANIAKYLSRGKVDLLPKNADFNGDGKVNVRDAAAIAKFLATGNR